MELKPFNESKIRKELDGLPPDDRAKLVAALKAFQDGLEIGWAVKDYGGGLKMITDSGRGQGRCLFFFVESEIGIIVKIYKKESQEVPQSVLEAARRRWSHYE